MNVPRKKSKLDNRFHSAALSKAEFVGARRRAGAGAALLTIAQEMGVMLSHVGFAVQTDSYDEYLDCVGVQKRGEVASVWSA